jgi:hypothetical protein
VQLVLLEVLVLGVHGDCTPCIRHLQRSSQAAVLLQQQQLRLMV